MRDIPDRAFGRAALGAALFVIVPVILFASSPASAAGYPRRVAVAPFASLTAEDIGQTVAILPRLLGSRLMALAGADVLLLPRDGKNPEAAAKEANYPLLIKGTVAKLGKGYSIDTTVTDLATGAVAGAYFAAAATEDDIIAQLGILSGEIAEKLFGVQGAGRAVSPAPPPPPVAAPAAPAAGVAAVPMPPAGTAASAAPPASALAPPPTPVPGAVAEGWIPSSLKKVGQSDKITDEVHGIVAGDVDAEGNGEVVGFSRTAIFVYRVKGNELLPYTRITRSSTHQLLNVEAVDLDGDGKKDLVVTDREGDRLTSYVMQRKGDGFVEIPGTSPYFLVAVRDAGGKGVIAGQREGVGGDPFQGKFHRMKWDGKSFTEAGVIPIDTSILPTSAGGVISLAAGRFEPEERWIYVDVEEQLRVLDAGGKSVYKSKEKYGAASDSFGYGQIDRLTGVRPVMALRRAPRVTAGAKGAPLVVTTEVKKGFLSTMAGTFESTRVVILEWSGGGFTERAATPKSDFFISGVDVLPPGGLRKGGKVVASVIEQVGAAWKDKASHLELLQVE
jgi:hypothetical protein